jgi:hypothetical protein
MVDNLQGVFGDIIGLPIVPINFHRLHEDEWLPYLSLEVDHSVDIPYVDQCSLSPKRTSDGTNLDASEVVLW